MGKRHDSSCQYASKGRYFGHKKRSITAILRVMLLFFALIFYFTDERKEVFVYIILFYGKKCPKSQKSDSVTNGAGGVELVRSNAIFYYESRM